MKPGDLERVRIEPGDFARVYATRGRKPEVPRLIACGSDCESDWVSHPAWQVLGQNRKRAEPEADMGVQTIGTFGGVHTIHLCGGREAHLA